MARAAGARRAFEQALVAQWVEAGTMRDAVQSARSARLTSLQARNGQVGRAGRILSGIEGQPDTAHPAEPGWLRLAGALIRTGETGRAIACYERLLSRRVQSRVGTLSGCGGYRAL